MKATEQYFHMVEYVAQYPTTSVWKGSTSPYSAQQI